MIRNRCWSVGVCCMFLILSACERPHAPLYIRNMSINPTPSIGRITNLYVEAYNDYEDLEDVRLNIDLPEGIYLVSGEIEARFPLKKGEARVHSIEICSIEEGDHKILASVAGDLKESGSIGDMDGIHIINRWPFTELIKSKNYTYYESWITPPPPGIEKVIPSGCIRP